MTHTTIQLTILGVFATVIVAALLERRRVTDRIVRRRWMHVALGTGALALTTVPWLLAVGADLSAVDWRVLSVSVAPYLLLFGFLLLAQGTLFDLSRDRICRRCGFDLRMREGLMCNECGRVAKSEAHLRAIRPSRTLQIAALLVCVGALVAWRGVETRESGWRGAIPDSVLLALWPWLPDAVVTGSGGNVKGTLVWRLRNGTAMRQTGSIEERILRRLERATTIEEFSRLLQLHNVAPSRSRDLPLISAATIGRIVRAMETADDPNGVDLMIVSEWLVRNLRWAAIVDESIEALGGHLARLGAVADSAAIAPDLRSRTAAHLMVTVAQEPGQIPVAAFLDLLRFGDANFQREIARILALDPALHAAVLERAVDVEDPHASTYLSHLLYFGGPFDAAPDLRRPAVEAGLALLANARENGLHLRSVAVAISRVENLPADLDTAVALEMTIAGQYADDRILRLFERGPAPEALAAIERFRPDFEQAVAAEMPPAPPAVGLHELSRDEWDLLNTREAQRILASQSAMLLAWATAHSGGRHEPSATLLETHADELWRSLERAVELLQHLHSMGAIDVPAVALAEERTEVPD